MSSIPQDQPAPLTMPGPRRRRLRALRLLVCILIIYVVWCGLLYVGQDRLLFRFDLIPPVSAERTGWSRHAQRLTLDWDGGGQVEAWFLPAAVHPERPRSPAVMFFHGNAELIEHQEWVVENYHAMGYSVLLPEYRGYGRCAGQPSEAGIVADAVRFYDLLAARPDVDPTRIVFHGRSLGGGVAAQVAARRKPAALLLESTFTSVAVMAHNYFAPEFLAKHPFRTDEVLPTLDVPILIMHGRNDTIVPIDHAHKNRELARNATCIEYECDHNDFPGTGREAEHWLNIREFLHQVFRRGVSGPSMPAEPDCAD
jgi:fermentation-respiration switch protein FrsA (DUF1100 family)